MKTKLKIPKKFKLFGSTYKVLFNNKMMNHKGRYGESNYSKCEIVLSTTDNIEPLSDDRIIETFYHEKVHAILDAMHERDLSDNEKFVDTFAKLWRQSDETAKY